MQVFVAIDFETCHTKRDSACCVGVVRVESGKVVAREKRLIRPPLRREWMFTSIHGIRRGDVAAAPEFREVWRGLQPWLKGVDGFVVVAARWEGATRHAEKGPGEKVRATSLWRKEFVLRGGRHGGR